MSLSSHPHQSRKRSERGTHRTLREQEKNPISILNFSLSNRFIFLGLNITFFDNVQAVCDSLKSILTTPSVFPQIKKEHFSEVPVELWGDDTQNMHITVQKLLAEHQFKKYTEW